MQLGGSHAEVLLTSSLKQSLFCCAPAVCLTSRGWHFKHFSIISIMLHYVFALLRNTLTLLKCVIPSIIYRSGHIVPLSLLIVIAISISISLIVSTRYCFSIIMYLIISSPIPLSKELAGDLNFFTKFAPYI
jgi:hypothetical protein